MATHPVRIDADLHRRLVMLTGVGLIEGILPFVNRAVQELMEAEGLTAQAEAIERTMKRHRAPARSGD